MLLYYPLRRRGPSESLLHRWFGPYHMIKQLRPCSYLLQCVAIGMKTSAHVVRMKPCTPPNPTQSTVNISLSHSKDEGGGVESANPSSKNLEFLGTNQEVLTKWEKYKRCKKRK